MRFWSTNKNAHFTLSTTMIKILIGGSPCTHWSIVRARNKVEEGLREIEATGIGWELFKNYLIAKEKFQPDFFLYENNESISKAIQAQISEELGVELLHLNSSAVSAQNRKRIYGTNTTVKMPIDRGITLEQIVDDDVQPIALYRPRFKESKCRIYTDGKSPTITAAGGGEHIPRLLLKGYTREDISPATYKDISRTMTVAEVERLQTMPNGYTKTLSKTRAMNALGNGWTAEIIMHIIKSWNIPLDEEIVVLSMYDGIATGRYCFDRLGYTNIKYYAYEIDKYAIQCALDNYTDIVECGDAFQVREDDWFLTRNLTANGRKEKYGKINKEINR